jgi:hypothetical protein
LSAQAIGQSRLTIHPVVGGIGIGDVLIPAHSRNPVVASLKARCVAVSAASWLSTSSLQQMVRLSVLLKRAV